MKNKRAIYYFLPIILLVFTLIIFFFTSSWYLNKVVRVRIQDELKEQTSGQYSLVIKSMKISYLKGSVNFRGIQLLPAEVPESKAAYALTCTGMKFTGLNIFKFIRGKKIVVDRIELIAPSLKINQGSPGLSKEADTTATFSLYNLVKEFAKSITIKKLEFSNSDVSLFSSRSDTIPSLYSNDNHFKIVNLYIGPSTDTISGLFTADSISLVMNKFAYTTDDSLYTFKVKRMEVSYKDSTLNIDSVQLIPNYSKGQFANVAGKQTNRYNISAGNLFFNKMDLRRFFEQHDIISASLDISRFSLATFLDKNDKREYNIPASLQQILLEAPVYLKVDTIKVSNSVIVYEEIASGKKAAGHITFNDISANLTGLTNDSILITKGRNLYFMAECNFMDKSRLTASYTFPLNTRQMVFECNGFLTNFPMSALNGMLQPSAGISLDQGVIDTLDFSFSANEESSKGTMKFIYHDLKLELPDEGNRSGKLKDKLTVFVANNFILKQSNPRENEDPRTVGIYYQRNKQRFMFHYTWHTLFSGIKETIGMPKIKTSK